MAKVDNITITPIDGTKYRLEYDILRGGYFSHEGGAHTIKELRRFSTDKGYLKAVRDYIGRWLERLEETKANIGTLTREISCLQATKTVKEGQLDYLETELAALTGESVVEVEEVDNERQDD